VKFFAFRKVEIGVERGTNTKQELQKKKALNDAHAKSLDEMLSQLSWGFSFKTSDQKALEKGKVPKSMKAVVEKAHDANNRLSAEGMKLLKKLEDGSDLWKKLKAEYCTSQKHISDLKHLMDFQELPNMAELTKGNFDKMLKDVADNTSALNESVEMAKGKIRASST